MADSETTDSRRDPYLPRDVDLEHPSVARVYDYYLGGTSNWAIDREFGAKALAAFPFVRPAAKANRQFLHRVVRYLAKSGIRQFVDLGSGIPTMGPTHVVADRVNPESAVVYVDNEPVAVAHSQVLLERDGDPARHAAINGDLRDPEGLWERIAETGVIDFSEPVALLMIAVLHVQQLDADGVDQTPDILARYRTLLTPGSYLAISHGSSDGVPGQRALDMANFARMYEQSSTPVRWRPRAEIDLLFGDLEMVPPGTTWTPLWHPEESTADSPVIDFDSPEDSVVWAGVARKN
ncbi:SAM-dependent methyltransferase [Amycolatopsis cynarae]|uniref:SAM-dependent methyltransferase n=1 Tax=Amycolatopsis cynarae TaxID=2995223 RepID=A0ABY7BBB1_9PSEU|nr:SAM-dependent methyltransferase [Amycolatopsis sp. HUAS 11-8]WAL67973.1 SAM-dependent methyltransferase [Amycolatopsis sp. HUAS 11-8]